MPSAEEQLRYAKSQLRSTVFDSRMMGLELRSLQSDIDNTQYEIKLKEFIQRKENPGLEEDEPEETDRTIRPGEDPTEYYDRRRSEIEEREWARADAKKKQAWAERELASAEFEEGVDKRTKEALKKAAVSDSNLRTHMYAVGFLLIALYIAHPDPY